MGTTNFDYRPSVIRSGNITFSSVDASTEISRGVLFSVPVADDNYEVTLEIVSIISSNENFKEINTLSCEISEKSIDGFTFTFKNNSNSYLNHITYRYRVFKTVKSIPGVSGEPYFLTDEDKSDIVDLILEKIERAESQRL